MERISQLFGNLKERLSSPFFFSFIVAWLIYNWSIPLALFWSIPIKGSDGYSSLISFISGETKNFDKVFWFPFYVALAYTFVYPFFRNAIIAFQTWITTWGENLNLRLSNGGKVPIDKYLSLRKNYEKRTKTLEEVITNETGTLNQLQNARADLTNAKAEVNKVRNELNESRSIVNAYNDITIFGGKWVRTTKFKDEQTKEHIDIVGNIVYIYDGIRQKQRFTIQHFTFNQQTGKLLLSLFVSDFADGNFDYGFFAFNDLTYRPGEFVGNEYQTGKVVEVLYTKAGRVPVKTNTNTSKKKVK